MLPSIGRRRALVALTGVILLTVAGCGSSEAPADPGAPVEVAITITGGRSQPQPGRVDAKKNQQVRITVTSDVADRVHVHGYEVGADLRAGQPATVEFVADMDGLFEVETHETGLLLFQLLVR
ncbi:hypothetical protein ACIBF5_20400 [Micromonospora sp. NPDC050417]|uniref:hypothetical protein n=1 Tax=Micromonospora sp. NPDC050417 TaxID=3364280 RepID=UPI00379BC801